MKTLLAMNEDISDGMIEDNAKIWCIFRGTDVSKALDEVIAQTKQKASEEVESGSESERLDEGKGRAAAKIGGAVLGGTTKAAGKTTGKVVRRAAGKAGKKAVGKAAGKATGKAAVKTAGKLAGQAAVNLGKGAAKHPWMTLAGAGAYMNRGTIAELYDQFKGKGNPDSIKASEDGTPDVDSWNQAAFKDQRAAVTSSKVDIDKLPAVEKWKYKFIAPRADKGWPAENILLSLAAAWGLWKARDYIWTRVKELVDWASSGKSLAVCEFSSDGDRYKAVFDMNAKKWKLYYAGSTITKEQSYPPKEVADKFFSTKFFSKLTDACFQSADKYLNDKAFAAVSAALCSDKKISSSAKDTIKDVFKSRKEILANLKDGKYTYI